MSDIRRTLYDAYGRTISREAGHGQVISRRLHPHIKVFEGVLNVTVYEDAIEAKGECFHCRGKVGALLRDTTGMMKRGEVTLTEVKKKLYDMIQERHYCGARIDDGKDLVKDFLKRFE